MLGQMLACNSHRIELGHPVADTVVAEDFVSLVRRELRWSRTIRATQSAGHFAAIVTHGFPIILALVLLHPTVIGALLLASLLTLRLALRSLVHARLRRPGASHLWLVPLREMLCLLVWLASFAGRRVVWRGHSYAVERDGSLIETPHAAIIPAVAEAQAD
jgi:ceramide glucosyltransferase